MLEAGSVQKDHSRLSLFIELSSPNWLWPVFKTLFLDIWALIRKSLIQYCTLLYNLSFQSLIANPSFPPSRHCSPPVLHVCSAVAVSPPRTHTQQQGQDSEPSFRITNKLLPANSTPVVQRDPGGSSERVSHEVLHCHVWEESRSVTHGPRSFLCCAAPSFHWHPHGGCVKAGLEAGFIHSFSHRYTLSISFLGGTGKGDLSPALCPDFGGNKCQFHTVVYEHSGDSCICAPTQAADHSSALRYFFRVESNAIHSCGIPQSWKNTLDTSMCMDSKWAGHLEHYTPCSSQKSEIFSDQSAELLQPCAESQPKDKELHSGHEVGMKMISTPILGTCGNFTLNGNCWNH